MLDVIRLFKEKGIQYDLEGKHSRRGWVQTLCPFCASRHKYFLGYSLESGAWNCWQCGKHEEWAVLRKLLPHEEAYTIYEKYGIKKGKAVVRRKKEYERDVEVSLPLGCADMQVAHKLYLESRLFDPEKLARIWKLMGTWRIGDYRNRIIAPIYLDGKLISFQGRDITGKSELKYKACPQEKEARDHKSSLYGIDLAVGKSAVIVEGIADAWRLGPGAVATFGTAFTPPQVNLFCKRYTRGFVLFDPEEDAQKRAESIASQLLVRGLDCEILYYPDSDPGDIPQGIAGNLMKELLG